MFMLSLSKAAGTLSQETELYIFSHYSSVKSVHLKSDPYLLPKKDWSGHLQSLPHWF